MDFMNMFDGIDIDIDDLVEVNGVRVTKEEAVRIRNEEAAKEKEKELKAALEADNLAREMEAKERKRKAKEASDKLAREKKEADKKEAEKKSAKEIADKLAREKKAADKKEADKKEADRKEAEKKKAKETADKLAREKKAANKKEADKIEKKKAKEAADKLAQEKKAIDVSNIDWDLPTEELITRYSVFLARDGDKAGFVCPHADCKVEKPFPSHSELVDHHLNSHHSWLCGCMGEGSPCSNAKEVWVHLKAHVLGLKKISRGSKIDKKATKTFIKKYGEGVFTCPLCNLRCESFSDFLYHCIDEDFHEDHSWLALMHFHTLVLNADLGLVPAFALPLRFSCLPEDCRALEGEKGSSFWLGKMQEFNDDISDEEIVGEIRPDSDFNCPLCPNHENLPLSAEGMKSHLLTHVTHRSKKKNKCFVCGTKFLKQSEHSISDCYKKYSQDGKFICHRCGDVEVKGGISSVESYISHCAEHMISKDVKFDSEESRSILTRGHSKRNGNKSLVNSNRMKQMHESCKPLLDMLENFRGARRAAGNGDNFKSVATPLQRSQSSTRANTPLINSTTKPMTTKTSYEEKVNPKSQFRQAHTSGASSWTLPAKPFTELQIPNGLSGPEYNLFCQKHMEKLFCPICSVGVGLGFQSLSEHFIIHHNDANNPCFLKCPYCPSLFEDPRQIRQHLNARHKNTVEVFPFPIKCNFCGESFKSAFKFLEHTLHDSHIRNHSVVGFIDASTIIQSAINSKPCDSVDDAIEKEALQQLAKEKADKEIKQKEEELRLKREREKQHVEQMKKEEEERKLKQQQQQQQEEEEEARKEEERKLKDAIELKRQQELQKQQQEEEEDEDEDEVNITTSNKTEEETAGYWKKKYLDAHKELEWLKAQCEEHGVNLEE